MTPETKERLHCIDGLRGFVALIIIGAHIVMSLMPKNLPVFLQNSGIIAVQIFFGLSGMLVFVSFAKKAQREKKPVLNFYLRRMARILPLWWFLLAVAYFTKDAPWQVWISNAFFYFGFLLADFNYDPIGTGWALFVEVTFYLIFPLLFPKLGPKKIIPMLLVTSFLSYYWFRFAPDLGVPTANHFVKRFTFSHLRFFLVGIAVSQLLISGVLWERFKEGLRPWLDVILALTILTLLFTDKYSREIFVAICLLTAFIEGTLIYRILSFRFLHWIGVRCYGYYLLHCPVLFFVLQFLPENFSGYAEQSTLFKFAVLFSLVVSFTTVWAGFTYRWIEMPMMAWGEKKIMDREVARA